MEEPKNLLIKVKYPSSEKKPAKKVNSARIVTVWNIKRLLIAFAVSAALIVIVIFLIMRPSSQEMEVKPTVVATETHKTEAKAIPLVKSNAVTKKTITRAILTLAIKNNEPVAELNPPLILPINKTVPVYYFIEVTDMKDRVISHERW